MNRSERLNASLISNLEKFAEIPNLPFFYEPTASKVIIALEHYGFSRGHNEYCNKNSEKIWETDEHGIYALIRRGNPKHRLLVVTHLDHPGIVLDGNRQGIPLGSVPIESLESRIRSEGIPIKVYDKHGKLNDYDTLTEIRQHRHRTKVRTRNKHPRNSQAIWDIDTFSLTENFIGMINSDNMLNTAIILEVINNLLRTEDLPIDVEFMFGYVEEIKQISATGIALRSETPLRKIDNNTVIVVLESASVFTPNEYTPVISRLELSPAQYDRGIVVRINDLNLLYGQKVASPNLGEMYLLDACLSTGVKYQQSLLGGTCDATPFTLFTSTPNIVGITIPTQNKHNVCNTGEIKQEVTAIDDVLACKLALMHMILGEDKNIHEAGQLAICHKLKMEGNPMWTRNIGSLIRDRRTTYKSSLARLRHAQFFPEGPIEQIEYNLMKLKAKTPYLR